MVALPRRAYRFFTVACVYICIGIVVKLILLAAGMKSGVGFATQDEVARVVYASRFGSYGDTSSFDYFWLPLQFIVVGILGRLLGSEYYVATLISNSALSVMTIAFGMLSIGQIARDDERSERDTSGIAQLIAFIIAITTPWGTIGSLTGFAEPFAWFGVSGAILFLLISERSFARALWALPLAGLFLAIASFSRYESWLLSTVFPVAAILVSGGHLTSKRTVRCRSLLVVVVIGSSLVSIAPIVYWLVVQYQVSGNPLKVLEYTHRFETDAFGRASKLLTLSRFVGLSLPYSPLLAPLIAISLLPQRWNVRYAILLGLPFLQLLAIALSVTSGGIPWIMPDRLF